MDFSDFLTIHRLQLHPTGRDTDDSVALHRQRLANSGDDAVYLLVLRFSFIGFLEDWRLVRRHALLIDLSLCHCKECRFFAVWIYRGCHFNQGIRFTDGQ